MTIKISKWNYVGNGQDNCLAVEIGDLNFYFYYETIIAFKNQDGLQISKNVWSKTTGKYLNAINPDKNIRLEYKEFLESLEKCLNEHNLVIG